MNNLKSSGSFFLNPGCFTDALAQVENSCSSNLTTAVHLDFINKRTVQWEYTFYTNSVGDFTNREGFSNTGIAALNHITLKQLNTLLVTFLDFVVYGNTVTGLEIGYLLTQIFSADCFNYRIHRIGEWGCKCRNNQNKMQSIDVIIQKGHKPYF